MAAHVASQTTLTGDQPERVGIEEVTTAYLTTLGVTVAAGSDFPPELDAGAGARKVALISDALWQRRFGKAPADEREKARQARFLVARGYATSVVFRVLRAAGARADESDAV